MRKLLGWSVAPASATLAAAASTAMAAQPTPWQIGFQPFVTEMGENINSFMTGLNYLIFAISIFVLALLVYCLWRFSEKRNPTPSKVAHHTGLEIAWTAIPVVILFFIAIPSFSLLRKQLVIPPADLVVKATGRSWDWQYEYPKEYGGFNFVSAMLSEEDRKKDKPNEPRLLAVSDDLVVPVNKTVVVQVTSADVLHAFAVPSFGIKIDAVPGRLNQTWFRATKEGIYYGQCSELCGRNHAFMPIAVRVVSQEAYDKWLAEAKTKYAANEPAEAPRFAGRQDEAR
jgi:cytochrome c oxidase subunit 2